MHVSDGAVTSTRIITHAGHRIGRSYYLCLSHKLPPLILVATNMACISSSARTRRKRPGRSYLIGARRPWFPAASFHGQFKLCCSQSKEAALQQLWNASRSQYAPHPLGLASITTCNLQPVQDPVRVSLSLMNSFLVQMEHR